MILLEEYAKRTGIAVEDILGRSRRAEVVAARQVWWWYLRSYGRGYSEIGRQFDRDHATVLQGVKHVVELIEVGDPYLQRYINAIEQGD
jgi:chromosomal replication initiation ATPase DnaA